MLNLDILKNKMFEIKLTNIKKSYKLKGFEKPYFLRNLNDGN